MAPLPGMETLAARLSSFHMRLPATKRRGSNTKGQKIISWPLTTPSPEELAEAGFYYNPSVSSPDNTSCFLCERDVAGWEDDDEPLTEHLKLSSHCGWAIIKNIGQEGEDVSTMEDPTNERLFNARKSTFASGWPHEHKRGWVCKAEKMAAAGWHFAPTPEFEDFVSCAYCNLSLDGWEPKDSPFEEHYRRSPGCAFFVFAGTTAPKPGRGKKARASKASRLSTQSNVTNISQVQSIPDFNDSIDGSNVSQATFLSTVPTMAGKKAGKAKEKSARAKNTALIEIVETSLDATHKGATEQAVATRRGTKRKSEDISEDHRVGRESDITPEARPKRRATRNRISETQQVDYPVLVASEAIHLDPANDVKKPTSLRTRKRSTASAATTASGRRRPIPDDAEIEAALEADLDQAMSDPAKVKLDGVEELLESKSRSRTKYKSAATTPSESTIKETAKSETSQSHAAGLGDPPSDPTVEKEDKPTLKGKSRKGRVGKKTVNKRTARRDSSESTVTIQTNADSQLNSSLLTAQTIADESGHETDASKPVRKSVKKKGGARKGNVKAKGKKAGLMSKNIEDIVQIKSGSLSIAKQAASAEPEAGTIVVDLQMAGHHGSEEVVEADQPQRVTRATRGAKAKGHPLTKADTKFPQLSMPGMFSPSIDDVDPSFNSVLATSSPPVARARSGVGADRRIPVTLGRSSSPKLPQPTDGNAFISAVRVSTPPNHEISPPRRNKNTNEATPSPSPQSSDAENQPPSSRPPSVRPPLAPLSPRNVPTQRIPLALGTPRQAHMSPSKIGGLRSAMPWTAVDVEMIFAPSPEKENRNIFAGVQQTRLTSPEKAMSVEEWIRSQASGAEETLKAEAERIVNIFEREGGRALGVLESIEALE